MNGLATSNKNGERKLAKWLEFFVHANFGGGQLLEANQLNNYKELFYRSLYFVAGSFACFFNLLQQSLLPPVLPPVESIKGE